MKKAFTLIELLVVVSIIFLLTSIFISNAQEARKKAADAKKQIEVREVQKAMFAFQNDNDGSLPVSGNPGLHKEGTGNYSSIMNQLVSQKYISQVPKSDDEKSFYISETNNGSTFLARLESEGGEQCVVSDPNSNCVVNETGQEGIVEIIITDSAGNSTSHTIDDDTGDIQESCTIVYSNINVAWNGIGGGYLGNPHMYDDPVEDVTSHNLCSQSNYYCVSIPTESAMLQVLNDYGFYSSCSGYLCVVIEGFHVDNYDELTPDSAVFVLPLLQDKVGEEVCG